jgi:hypothetical protein
MTNTCLNCSKKLDGDYCSHCGQSASTHRFTLKHVFTQDLLRVLFYIHKGFFFTIKELFTRPGHSIREYVSGKRVKHLNYLTLLIVILLVFSLIEQVTPFHFTELVDEENEIYEIFDTVLREYPKFVYIGIIPIYAAFSYVLFRKAKQNYAENFVLNSFRVSAIIIMNILFLSFASIVRDISIIRKADTLLAWIGAGYGTWFYYQYFSPFYNNKFILVVKSLLCAVLPGFLVALAIIAYFVLEGGIKLG